MSLYNCIDLIDDELAYLSAPSFFAGIRRKLGLGDNSEQVTRDKAFLEMLRAHLSRRVQTNNYIDLFIAINLINSHLEANKNSEITYCLNDILDDLKTINLQFQQRDQNRQFLQRPLFQQFSRCRIAEPIELYFLGNSGGICYGYTHACADLSISPYNPQAVIDLQRVHDSQKQQKDREKDQKRIKKIRLTREYFCPDPKQQAQDMLRFAAQHKGKDLGISLRGLSGLFSIERHIFYLSVQHNGKIRYADLTYGAYLFENENDFITFYSEVSKLLITVGKHYRFYRLSQLQNDEHNTIPDSQTISGKIRTLLTGAKYEDSMNPLSWVDLIILTLYGTVLIGGAICVLPPTLLGSAILISVYVGHLLLLLANLQGNSGLMALPHLIQNSWYSLKEKIASLISPEKSNNNKVEEKLNIGSNMECSSFKMLSLMPKQQNSSSKDETLNTEGEHNNVVASKHTIMASVNPVIASASEATQGYEVGSYQL